MADAIEAVISTADFGPFYEGEKFVTVTFRVPADTRVPAGVWELKPMGPGRPEWSIAKSERKD